MRFANLVHKSCISYGTEGQGLEVTPSVQLCALIVWAELRI